MFQQHIVCVRCAYRTEELSATRLQLSRQTIVPSLLNQGVQYSLHLSIDPADPLLTERVEMFRQLDTPIQIGRGISHDLRAKRSPALWSRIDDDDAVADNYLDQTQYWANRGKTYIGFDYGLVATDGKLYDARIPGNMFCSVLSSDPAWNIFMESHRDLPKSRNASLIQDKSAWIWVRHSTTKSKCLSRYLGAETTFPGERYLGVELP